MDKPRLLFNRDVGGRVFEVRRLSCTSTCRSLLVYLPNALSEVVVQKEVRRPSVRLPGGFVRFLVLLFRGFLMLSIFSVGPPCPPWPCLVFLLLALGVDDWVPQVVFLASERRSTLCMYQLH